MSGSNSDQTPDKQPLWFLLILALAVAGGAVAYVPFLTVLLPVRIGQLEGDGAVEALAYVTFAGAVIASLANIGFGWASDVTRNRRGWIAAGMLISGMLLICVRWADSVPLLIAIIMAWQVGLNMMLAPILAWSGDCVPDNQKGLLGGLLAFAPAIGALSGAFVTIPDLFDQSTRYVVVAGLVVMMVTPALILGRDRSLAHLMIQEEQAPSEALPLAGTARSAKEVKRMWGARLLVQIAEAGLFAFLLLWLRSLSMGLNESDSARLFSVVLMISVPLALLAGRWSDRNDRPFLPLAITAGLSALGLLGMAVAPAAYLAIASYMLFGITSMIFLALHSSQTLRVLPRPQTRGRDLGIFNLTNTIPSLIVPWLALSLIPLFGFEALFVVLAILSASACILVSSLARKT